MTRARFPDNRPPRALRSLRFARFLSTGGENPARAVPLASVRQHPETQKENQAGHSPERAVEGQRQAPACATHCCCGRAGRA